MHVATVPEDLRRRVEGALALHHADWERIFAGHSKTVWMVAGNGMRWFVTPLKPQELTVYSQAGRLPVPALECVVDWGDGVYGLFAELPGRPLKAVLASADVSMRLRLARVYGELAATIHRAFAPPGIRRLGARDWLGILEQGAGKHPHLALACERLATGNPADRVLTFTHGDLAGQHVFVEHERVTGVIDWEWASVTNPAMDLGHRLPRGDAYWGAAGAVWACLEAYEEAGGAYDLTDIAWYAVMRVALTLLASLNGDPRLAEKRSRLEQRLDSMMHFHATVMHGEVRW